MASGLISQGLGSSGSVVYLVTLGLDSGDPVQLSAAEADLREMPRRDRVRGVDTRDRDRTMPIRRRTEAA